MINILKDVRLSPEQVFELLWRFDDAFEVPLHQGIDFEIYSKKLSQFAHFLIAKERESQIGFIAYYFNEEGHFVYVPFTAVRNSDRHRGIGHMMFSSLTQMCMTNGFPVIRLEVLKTNSVARAFYSREEFAISEDHGERLLLEKKVEE